MVWILLQNHRQFLPEFQSYPNSWSGHCRIDILIRCNAWQSVWSNPYLGNFPECAFWILFEGMFRSRQRCPSCEIGKTSSDILSLALTIGMQLLVAFGRPLNSSILPTPLTRSPYLVISSLFWNNCLVWETGVGIASNSLKNSVPVNSRYARICTSEMPVPSLPALVCWGISILLSQIGYSFPSLTCQP